MSPVRIQRKRAKGWRMPEGAVYVGRGSLWGNPFAIGWAILIESPNDVVDKNGARILGSMGTIENAGQAVAWFKAHCEHWPGIRIRARKELKGKDLACWCPLDKPCHADVLLELANA